MAMVSISEAARSMGRVKSERKAVAARENGKKGGAPIKPLEEIACTCGGQGLDHKSTCPRRIRIRVRVKQGLPLT
jgi:hypothetical protein